MNNKFFMLLGVVVAALIVGCILFAYLLVSRSSNPIIVVDSSVFEGEKWMKIFDNGTVRGYSYHLYPWYKDIEIREGNVSREEIDVLLELFSNLADYNKYEVNVSSWGGGGYIFEPLGYTTISCLPLNKTIELHFWPPDFLEPETITPEAEEILARIDKLYQETEVVERIREMNPN